MRCPTTKGVGITNKKKAHDRPQWSIEGRSYRSILVGARGFEPPTPRSRTECSTRLSHAPTEANCYLTPDTTVNATALVVVARVKRSLTLTSKSRVIAGLEHVAVPREAGLGRAINGLGEVDCLD